MTDAEHNEALELAEAQRRLSGFLSLATSPAWLEIQALIEEENVRAVKLLSKRDAATEKRAEALELYHFTEKMKDFVCQEINRLRKFIEN